MMSASSRSVLGTLSKARLLDLGRDSGLALDPAAAKEAQLKVLADSGRIRFRDLLGRLGRDELNAARRSHRLYDLRAPTVTGATAWLG